MGSQPEVTFMLVGRSPVMQELRLQVARLGPTMFTVLVTGESGTGKELVARELHAAGRSARGPFVAVNCAAIVDSLLEAELFGIEERTATGVRGRQGRFEQAEGGTLFLDEVADLSASAQAKLLRVLQDRHVERVGGGRGRVVSTRVIAATNRSLEASVTAGTFRGDLYYRLSGIEVRAPSLREHREDIPLLADHLIDRHRGGRRLRCSPGAVEAMCAYEWPGNVRQLERAIERAIAFSDDGEIDVQHLPGAVAGIYGNLALAGDGGGMTLRAWSSRYARLVLERHAGNKRRACAELDISYHTLRALLAYGGRKRRAADGGVAVTAPMFHEHPAMDQ
jgi:DNA-binding NtrC family response regulator